MFAFFLKYDIILNQLWGVVMSKKKVFNFIIFIPFAIAIGSFILYFRYLFTIKGASKVTEIMEVSLVRYRNIGIFCLAIGVFLLFIKTLINYFRIDDEIEMRNERVLDRISSKTESDTNKYSFNENNIINDLLNNQDLKAIFYNGKVTEKSVKFKNYDKDKNIIEFYDYTKEKPVKTTEKVVEETKVISEPVKTEYVVNKDKDSDITKFKKCYKCKNIIARDSIICVHCGTVLKASKFNNNRKSTIFNPVRFAINMIVILLSIIILLLCINVITKQSKLNRNNLNIKTVELK